MVWQRVSISGQPGQFDVTLKVDGNATEFRAGAIIQATGWKPYDASKLGHLGYGSKNVITNVQMERLCHPGGPTGGKLLKPSDGGEIKSVAFLQCTGSRDENHLPFCSGVCCTASLKQSTYVLDQYPEADVHMFYIDVRTPGRLEDFYQARQDNEKLNLHRGKGIKVDPVDGGPTLYEFQVSKYALFTERQRVAVIRFLQAFAPDLDLGPIAREALANYWLKEDLA